MVSTCERSINVVRRNKQKAQITGLSQKGNGVGTRAIDTLVMGKRKETTLPAKRADLTCCIAQEERGKPDTLPGKGRRTVRRAVGVAGKGLWKKRKPSCNEMDRVIERMKIPTPKGG
jgi:hypothetical protein